MPFLDMHKRYLGIVSVGITNKEDAAEYLHRLMVSAHETKLK